MKFKILLIHIIFLLLIPAIKAQVTIGSNFPSRAGSLLDLKENAETGKNANAKKGLGLPRVKLESFTKLTIDDDAHGNDYRGVTVYNTGNTILAEGIYVWNGTKWMRIILVNSMGDNGNALINKGGNTYGWSDITIPSFSFHRPTQTSSFDESKATTRTYYWRDIVCNDLGSSKYTPDANAFNGHYVYEDNLYIQTDSGKEKYVLIEMTATISKKTNGSNPNQNPPQYVTLRKGYWETMQVEIFLDGKVLKTYERNYSNSGNGLPITVIDLFSVIPLTTYKKNAYSLKIKIVNLRNQYFTNGSKHSTPGNFDDTNKYRDFYTIKMEDFGLVLYENE